MKKRAYFHDYGKPEYLDGAVMQFSVHSAPFPGGKTLAYFRVRAHALAFARIIGKEVIKSTTRSWLRARRRT